MGLQGRITLFFTSVFVTLLLTALSSEAAERKIPVIIDTDIAIGYPGHDVDDGLMLAIALNSPELEILGVTTSWGNHRQEKTHAKAREVLAAAGRSDIPCFSGARGPKDLGRETPASRFIRETILSRPGEVTLLVVGTQTNIATAILSDPKVAPAIKQIVIMGGTPAPPGKWPFWAVIDLNLGTDLKSAKVVFESGVPLHVCTSPLCLQTVMTRKRYRRMVREAPFLRDLLAKQTKSWYYLSLVISPKPCERGFVPWDVMALAYLLHPEWFEDNWVKGEIDDHGWGYKTIRVFQQGLSPGEGDFNAPSRIINKDAFWEWFFSRI